jgi:hypothetical protein
LSFQKTFKVDGIRIKVTANINIPKKVIGDVKDFIKGRWQFSNVKDSIEFVKKWNSLQQKAKDKKVDFCQYQCKLKELIAYRRSKFAESGLATEREIMSEDFEGKYGENYRVSITLGVPLEQMEGIGLIESYRLLGFKSKFSYEVLKRLIVAEGKPRNRPPPSYQTPQELIAWLGRKDLSRDKEAIAEMISALKQTLGKFEVTTDAGDDLKWSISQSLDEILSDFNKRSADPPEHEGMVFRSEVRDMKLLSAVEEISDEAYDCYKLGHAVPEEPEEEVFYVKDEEEARNLAEMLGRGIKYKIREE